MIMKKLILLSIVILMGFSGFAQDNTVLIFQSMLPKVVVEPEPLSDALALEIWNKMKAYPSPTAYWETGTGYTYSDVREIFIDAKEIFQDFILPFVGGTLVKTEAIYAEGNELIPAVYWNPATEKIAFRDYWRANFADSYVLDIVRIYLDYDSSALD